VKKVGEVESKRVNRSTSRKNERRSGKQKGKSFHFAGKRAEKWKAKEQIILLHVKKSREVESKRANHPLRVKKER
jgi:hypothetical protein